MGSSNKEDRQKEEKQSFQSLLTTLVKTTRELLSQKDSIASIESLHSRNEKLTRQLDEANALSQEQQAQLQREKQRNADFDQKLEEFFAAKVTEKDRLEKKLQQATKSATATAGHKENELLQRAEKAERELKQTQSDLTKEKIERKKLGASLDAAEFQLKELVANTGVEDVEPAVHHEILQSIDKRLRDLCFRHFNEPPTTCDDLAETSRQPLNQSKGFGLHSHTVMSLALTRTYPRALIAQSVIASKLAKDIFVPSCLPSPTGRGTMGEAIQRSNELVSRQRSILQSLLVTTFHREEGRLRLEILNSTVSDITVELRTLLSSQKTEAFQAEIRDFLEFATTQWVSIQRSSDWMSATLDLSIYPEHWRHGENSSGSSERLSSRYPTLILFPHIIYGESESPIYPGQTWCIEGTADSGVPTRGRDPSVSSKICESDGERGSIIRTPEIPNQIKPKTPKLRRQDKSSLERKGSSVTETV